MTTYQEREAKRIGLDKAIDKAGDYAHSLACRAIREENLRLTDWDRGVSTGDFARDSRHPRDLS